MANENKKFFPVWGIIVLAFLGLAVCSAGASYFFNTGEPVFGWASIGAAIACFVYGGYKANRKHNED